jgi:hypothetical protein
MALGSVKLLTTCFMNLTTPQRVLQVHGMYVTKQSRHQKSNIR